MGEIEKNAGGYLGHLRLDEGGKNLNEDLCYGCGSPDHYKKYCPRKKASGGICGGNLCCCGVGNEIRQLKTNLNLDESHPFTQVFNW